MINHLYPRVNSSPFYSSQFHKFNEQVKTQDINEYHVQYNQILSILNQVSLNIEQLISNLSYIYDSHGFTFRIHQYYQAIFKLLTPVQLIKVKQNNERIRQKQTQKATKLSKMSKIHECSVKKKNDKVKFQQQNQYQENEKVLKPSKTHPEKSLSSYPISVGKVSLNTFLAQKRDFPYSSRTSMTPEQEQTLCNWVHEQVAQKGRTISKTQMRKQAKKICNDPGFLGSTGWCRRFLLRNQDARILIQMNKQLTEEQQRRIQRAKISRKNRYQKYMQQIQEQKVKRQNENEYTQSQQNDVQVDYQYAQQQNNKMELNQVYDEQEQYKNTFDDKPLIQKQKCIPITSNQIKTKAQDQYKEVEKNRFEQNGI